MFSRFFNSVKKTKPIVLLQQKSQHLLFGGKIIQLPNGLILSGGEVIKDHNIFVILELYDPIKKIQVASRRLEEQCYSKILCLSKELIWIKCDFGKQYVMNSSTLQSDEQLEAEFNVHQVDFDSNIYLGELQFATRSSTDDGDHVLVVHDFSKMKFNQPASIILMPTEDASRSIIRNMIAFTALPNGLFACEVTGGKRSDFQILLFKKEPGPTLQFTQISTLYPNRQKTSDIIARDRFIALTDGRILTYHPSENHFQVWQADGQCVDEWTWHKDVTCNDTTFKPGFWTHDVIPLPDGEHLLVQTSKKELFSFKENLFLFNMRNRVVKPVDFNVGNSPHITMLKNAQIAVQTFSWFQNNTHLVCIDFNEMIAYRKEITKQLSSVGLYSDVNKLVTNYILDCTP